MSSFYIYFIALCKIKTHCCNNYYDIKLVLEFIHFKKVLCVLKVILFLKLNTESNL